MQSLEMTTMTEYISRDDVIKIAYYDFFEGKYVVNVPMIKEIPAADVAPVVHGRWVSVQNPQ